MDARYDVLIVGAGHGGAQSALALRQLKYQGSIALLGAEADPPYERPALSKDYLAGEKGIERMLILSAESWAQRNVSLLLSKRVVTVDALRHVVMCDDGCRVSYGTLIWAAGGRPRRLGCDGDHLRGVFTIRSRAEVDVIKRDLEQTSTVVIVGGGYIGLEAAAVLRKLGKHVTTLEAADRVLARVAGETLSRFYEEQHRAQGVDLRLNAKVDSIHGQDARVNAVRLSDGTHLPADMVIVGIGIVPAVEPLLAAGAAGGDGVDVDEYCHTTLQDIFAIGDCAMHANDYAGARIRLESVQNANDQANAVARTLTDAPTAYRAVPWFWSDQYDLKLQTIGISKGHDRTVIRGDIATRKFSIVYLRQGHVLALDCINSTKDFMQGRALVMGRLSPPLEQLADAAVPLKSLLPSAAT